MAPRLKVFTWSDGFHRFTVATSSRPKALEAWGVEQDLFKSGLAAEAADGSDREAALASPGEVIQTGETIDPGKVTKAKPRKETAAQKKAKARKVQLQAELTALEEETSAALEGLRDERAAIDQRIADAEGDAATRRAELKRALEKL